jgi:hypothetical protein
MRENRTSGSMRGCRKRAIFAARLRPTLPEPPSSAIAKAIPVSELGKGHRQILIPTREAARSRISTVPSDTTAKFAIRQKAQQLREDGSTLVHRPLWTVPPDRFRAGLAALQRRFGGTHNALRY